MRITFRRPSHSTVVAYLALFLATSGATYAATGGTFILGHTNTATTSTVLVNRGTGVALSLQARSGTPALAVGNAVKIRRLNADLVDGVHAGVLDPYIATVNDYNFSTGTVPLGSSATVLSKTLPAGKYLFNFTGFVDIFGASDDTHCDLYFGTTFGGMGGVVAGAPTPTTSFQAELAFTGVTSVPAGVPAHIVCGWANFDSPQQTPSVTLRFLSLTAIPVSGVR